MNETNTAHPAKVHYINPYVEKPQQPANDGTCYDASIPDTLDIAHRASLSVNALTECTDPDNALGEITSGFSVSNELTNPIGCNVKWEGQDAHWMPADACDLF